MKNTRSRKNILVNSIGTLGYLSLVVQWAWVIITVVLPRLPDNFYSLFFLNNSSAPKPTPLNFDIPDSIAWMLAGIITVVMLVTTIITLIRLPKAVGRQGARVTHASAARTLPLVTHHKKVTPTERTKVSYRLVLTIKFSATIVAFALLVFAIPIEQMTQQMILFIGLLCASFTSLYFGLQTLLARLLRVNRNTVW